MTEDKSTRLQILACQLDVANITNAEKRDCHLRKTAEKIRTRLSKRSADMVVLPELSSIDYARDAFDQLQELAEPDHGASFNIFSELAKEFAVTIVYGYPGLSNGHYTICQAAVGADGNLLGVYEKIHIAHYGASMEKDYFSRGKRLMLFEIKGIRIAPIICYDIRFPELSQTLATQYGVELILHCGAYFRDESFPSWHHFVVTRAMENQVFMLSLNRAGKNYGQSLFCPPWMDLDHPCENFNAQDEDFKYLSLDVQTITRARRYPFIRDRLENYKILPL